MEMAQIVSGTILTLIATFVGWMTSRASNKASTTNVITSSRVEMEKEAYERARKLDTESITRLEKERAELEERHEKLEDRYTKLEERSQALNDDVARVTLDNYQLHRENTRILEMNEQILAENRRLREAGERLAEANRQLGEEVSQLRLRITRIQRGISPTSTEPVRERETDIHPIAPEVEVGGE